VTFVVEKLEWFGYPMVKKIEDTFIRFDRVHERDGRTDRRTPRDGIGRAYASRGNKHQLHVTSICKIWARNRRQSQLGYGII